MGAASTQIGQLIRESPAKWSNRCKKSLEGKPQHAQKHTWPQCQKHESKPHTDLKKATRSVRFLSKLLTVLYNHQTNLSKNGAGFANFLPLTFLTQYADLDIFLPPTLKPISYQNLKIYQSGNKLKPPNVTKLRRLNISIPFQATNPLPKLFRVDGIVK